MLSSTITPEINNGQILDQEKNKDWTNIELPPVVTNDGTDLQNDPETELAKSIEAGRSESFSSAWEKHDDTSLDKDFNDFYNDGFNQSDKVRIEPGVSPVIEALPGGSVDIESREFQLGAVASHTEVST